MDIETTFYNPSVLNIIGWENKHIYLRSGILHGGEEGGGGVRGGGSGKRIHLFTLLKD